MRSLLKRLASFVLVPLTRWYLRKERKYIYRRTEVTVLPGVFHPGFFSSTVLILDYLEGRIEAGQSVLEVGSGTGLISVVAAKASANVTALDVSRAAIENTKRNAHSNNVKVTIIESDLFTNMPKGNFDWVIVNPPYYARDPQNESEFAWYCGRSFQYFRRLFKELPEYLHPQSKAILVLTKGCDTEKISAIGREQGFMFVLIKEKNALFDGKDMLYEVVYKVTGTVST